MEAVDIGIGTNKNFWPTKIIISKRDKSFAALLLTSTPQPSTLIKSVIISLLKILSYQI